MRQGNQGNQTNPTANSTSDQIPASPSSGVDRQLGPFDYPGPPRGTAVVAGLSSSVDEPTKVLPPRSGREDCTLGLKMAGPSR